MLQTGASHKNAGKKKAKQNKMKANCNLIIMRTIIPQPRAMMQSPQAHTRQLLSRTVLHRILEIKPKYVYQALNARLLNRGDNKQNSHWDGQKVAVAA